MTSQIQTSLDGIELQGASSPEFETVFTTEALAFLASLARKFQPTRKALLKKRLLRQKALEMGDQADFLTETEAIRKGDWSIAPVPEEIQDRRIEITGPVDRKMVINALNSGANVFMADFEDSTAPTWENVVSGQINLRDAIKGTITFTNPKGKQYKLNDKTAVLMTRPRGWHLEEKHLLIDGEPISASLFDFGLFFFHNTKALLAKGSAPYFYLPKLESHEEARLWNDVFVFAQKSLGIPNGTIKATVLIETILAAFEMDEILWELKDHSAGLNCGRWDYIFSVIKKFRNRPDFVMPDRGEVGMARHFMHSYSLLAIQTCHRRGAHAMGGMAANIPIKNDPEANEQALEKVRVDKVRESMDGHDGTWVAHPGLVTLARDIFDKNMPTPNQIHKKREDVRVTREDLLKVPEGKITEAGLRHNIDVGIQYLEAWLNGLGCVPIYNLMEDAATSEISRAQVWQWIHHDTGVLDDGRQVTAEMVREFMSEELSKITTLIGEERFKSGQFDLAGKLFDELVTSDDFAEFLTLGAYEHFE